MPTVIPDATSSWAQFTIQLPIKFDRTKFQTKMKEKNIPIAIYYPIPLHEQKPYKKYLLSNDNLKNTVYLSKHVMSLPMHPYLKENEIIYISKNINNFIKNY